MVLKRLQALEKRTYTRMAKSLFKRRYDLIPPEVLRLVADAFTHGTKHDQKGKEPGWIRVPEWRAHYTGALMRHFEAWRGGEWLDKDSKLPHLALTITNGIILLALELRARRTSHGPQ